MGVISRDEAREAGLKRFFTGTPCRRGHISERYVSDYSCIECQRRPERKAKVRAYDAAHKRKRKEYFKNWKSKNRERMNAHGRLWAKRHPEEHARRSRIRRARQRGAEGSHSVKEVKELLVRQKYKCPYCEKSLKAKYEVDHIVALSRGGSDNISNIQLLCVSCNRRKNAKDPIKWAQENGRLL